MSRSSSGSWSGGGAAPPADIIDLDRFMRAARPSHPRLRSQLVVDAGGPRAPAAASSSSSSAGRHAPRAAARTARAAPRHKRQSHDSGLSDGSYGRRRQRPHRRVSCESPAKPKEPVTSATSLRAFRTVCERALRDQQQQIARVAQLCERLTERRPSPPSDTSDITSSSRSTRDQRRKDKHRTEECKTYKIIMNKLDELNRLFAARTRSPPARPPARTRKADSTTSVSVSDKVVATETASPKPNSVSPTVAGDRSRRLTVLRAVAAGPALDIAPQSRRPQQPNVLTESVVKCDSSAASSSSGCNPHGGTDPHGSFDLDNPVHLYAQAKRLQAMHASTSQRREHADAAAPRASTLCALCREYLRALRQYLAAQLCYPAQPCAS